jgi:hypothetical protein
MTILGPNPHCELNNKYNDAVETRYAKTHLVEDYLLNIKMILAMQQLGCGLAGTTVIG